jgi:hypothetical protein
MCGPVAIAGVGLAATLGLGIAQSVSQYQGLKQSAKAQDRYQNTVKDQREKQIQENYDRVMESYRFKLMSEQVRLNEIRKSATQQAFNVQQAGLRARSTAAAQAASRGSAGQSTYLNLMDYLTQTGFAIAGINDQFGAEQRQSERNKQAFYLEAKNRASSIQPYVPGPVTYPSPVGMALQIGSSAASSFNAFGAPLVGAYNRAPALTGSNTSTAPAWYVG